MLVEDTIIEIGRGKWIAPFLHEVFSLVAIVKCKSGLRVGLNQVNDENSKLSYLMLGQKATGENSRINAGSGYSCFYIPVNKKNRTEQVNPEYGITARD